MRLNGFNLNHIVALDALLQEKSVTRAAQRCGKSQPYMSSVLRRLREYLGDPILIPAGRDLRLSPLARALTEPVREAVMQVETVLKPDQER
jgi:DNA-binding transcriptional LysR family regulator